MALLAVTARSQGIEDAQVARAPEDEINRGDPVAGGIRE